MLDLIKQNAVPAAVMRSAAKGILSVSSSEMLQILVCLAANPEFGDQAKTTLAEWDTASAVEIISSSSAPQDVLEYFWSAENRQARLMPALIENFRIPEQRLAELASQASRDIVDVLLASPRAQNSGLVLASLVRNTQLTPAEVEQVQAKLTAEASVPPGSAASQGEAAWSEPVDPELDAAHHAWKQNHAAEIAAEEGKAFELVDADARESMAAAGTAGPVGGAEGAENVALPHKANAKDLEPERLSTIQRLARMNVADRVKTAFLGNKEERSILVRDGSKIVQNAVLASPKLSELEAESFAALKNVQENVLREIARSRRFMKNYIVVKNLVNNPRCPLDISLTLVKNLLVMDLKVLQANKNVPDTVRKVAYKLFREKSAPPGQRE